MRAYKCDRCGQYYDNFDHHKIILPGAKTASQWERIGLECGGCAKRFDICMDCLEDFNFWLDEKKGTFENGSESC